ncbi:MAG: hypothetical protein O7G83_03090 [Proteobacteria bacterium]|nr:hypothetical protein [Pseudomonadota bacterium]
MRPITFSIYALGFVAVAGQAEAYVGPGLGLGAIGVAAGILLSFVLVLVALVWYPLKRLFVGRARNGAADAEGPARSNNVK